MYIPPQIRSREWRRFYAGCIFGAITGYILFVFINDQLHEHLEEENIQLSTELNEIEAKYESLVNEEKEADEEKNQALTIQEIVPSYSNAKELQVDKLTQHQLSSMVKDQLQSLTGENIEDISDQSELIIATIENKQFIVEDFTYTLTIERLIIANQLQLHLSITLEN
ncbi:sporulation membrane protein YtrI [Halobacillus sp. Marseille-P3879]|uniref:sporulation membrane protein YtrI n=1 Tax=Halobacillus TaxID=45667 RepID=UPI000C7A3051|nr:sporulation membrane protein YtrI [Halobacillus sp. Marseille-P3879]